MRKILHAIRRKVRAPKPPVKRISVTVDAPEGSYFSVSGGPSCKNVRELREAIKCMADWQYEYHTVPRGNDFSRWVKDVLGQEKLAKKLEEATSRQEAVKVLE